MVNSLSDAAYIFLLSAGLCLCVGRVIIGWLVRMRCVAPARHEDCPPLVPLQKGKSGTPTMAGVFVLPIAILVAALWGGFAHRDGWLVFASIIGFGAVGLCDDILKFRGPNATGLRMLPKLAVALAIGAGVGLVMSSQAGSDHVLEIPWLAGTIDLGLGWIPFAMFVTAGTAHAVNLTDGMDGLAAGCVAVALVVFGLWAMVGDPRGRVLVVWCASLAGACVGLLWFNSFPASVFLGDVGSLGLGAALATISLLSHSSLWLLVIGGVFVLEAVSVMAQVASYKWRGGRRIFRVAPLHHHFQLGGMSEPKVVMRFWIIGLLLAVLGMTTIELP